MIIKTNGHTHSTFCDGKATPEQMVVSAIEKGFYSLGFSGHSDCWLDVNSMTEQKTFEYAAEILRLKEKYKDKIKIFLGLEIDSLTKSEIPSLDYKIGSVHYVMGQNGEYCAVDQSYQAFEDAIGNGFNGNAMAFVKGYYDAVDEMLGRVKPDICGHFDLIGKMNEGNKYFDENSDDYKKIALPVLLKYIDKVIFEVNTGGMYRKYRTRAYPDIWLLEQIFENGGKVMVNTDCHNAESLDFKIDEQLDVLKKIGFKSVYVLGENGLTKKEI